jgi:class 3 adenylate cyclase
MWPASNATPPPSPASAKLDKAAPISYTPKHLADKILNTRSALEGERKLVTVMFADVTGFTSLSEKLEPEEVHQIMEGCLRILMDEIHQYEGTINQFTGDGVMACWAPARPITPAFSYPFFSMKIRIDIPNFQGKIIL